MLQDQSLDQFLDDYLTGGKQHRVYAFADDLRGMADEPECEVRPAVKEGKVGRKTWVELLILLVLVPLTVYIGYHFMGGRKYYFISLMLIIYSLCPFIMMFEGRKPQARELITISVLAAIAVAGRAAFFMLPSFKPVAALVIITGICFGGEAGFLVGAVSALISNFFFGQGPWTPWQMFAFGIIGYLAGLLYSKGLLKAKRLSLCIYGFVTVLCIYGILLNTSTVLQYYSTGISWKTALSIYILGVPVDLTHAASTVFFLFVFSKPMIEKLERVKKKYGLMQGTSAEQK